MKQKLLFASLALCLCGSVGAQTKTVIPTTANVAQLSVNQLTGDLYFFENGSTTTISKRSAAGVLQESWLTVPGLSVVGSYGPGILIDAAGNLYLNNYSASVNSSIIKITPSGTITYNWATLHNVGDYIIAGPDGAGNIYAWDGTPGGGGSLEIVGPAGGSPYYIGSTGSAGIVGAVVDKINNCLYYTNQNNGFNGLPIGKLTSSGVQTYPWATGTSGVFNAAGMVLDGSGNLFVGDKDVNITKFSKSGVVTNQFYTSQHGRFLALAIDYGNNLYAYDLDNYYLDKITSAAVGTEPWVSSLYPAANQYTAVYYDGHTGSIYATGYTNSITKINGGIALPITLTSFSGAKQGTANQLQWAVANAVGFKEFQLQRAGTSDGVYSSITTVPYNTVQANYSYADNTAVGDAYYRLAMVDVDGKTTYSSIVFIGGSSNAQKLSLKLYPVPAKSTINISMAQFATGAASYSIVDATGKLLSNGQFNLNGAAVAQPLDISHLGSGSYILKVTDAAGNTVSSKFLKQ